MTDSEDFYSNSRFDDFYRENARFRSNALNRSLGLWFFMFIFPDGGCFY